MRMFLLTFLNRIFLFVGPKIGIVRWKEIWLLWNYLMSMKCGLRNAKRRRKRNVRATIRIPVVSNVKDLFVSAKVERGKMTLKLRDKDYFWMWMRRRKLMDKQMASPCMQDTSLLSWNVLADNSSAGTPAQTKLYLH